MARALYIHWPFCARKCPYCDFNSHVRASVDIAEWETALITDMRHEATLCADQSLKSIFFGGGTPSLMPPVLVEKLIMEADRLWGLDENCEITLEANPSSVEADNFQNLAMAGVNRVSLGIQALNDPALRFLGRLHSVDEALEALATAHNSFDRVNFDLIYARPGQSPEDWQAELSRALSYGTQHLSLYQLTIEQGTRFASDYRMGKLRPLPDDNAADLFAVTREMTAKAGLPAYETSNFARPGCESRHNMTYWRYQDYCGIGPGAHGRRNGIATTRHRKPENYLEAVRAAGHGLQEERQLTAREMATEALLMGLRLTEGVDLKDLHERFGLKAGELVIPRKLALYEELGFLEGSEQRVAVTAAGAPLLDALLGELAAPESAGVT